MTIELWGSAELSEVVLRVDELDVESSPRESPGLTDKVGEAASFPGSVNVLLGETFVDSVDSSLLSGCASCATILLNKRHRQSRAPALGCPVTLMANMISGLCCRLKVRWKGIQGRLASRRHYPERGTRASLVHDMR